MNFPLRQLTNHKQSLLNIPVYFRQSLDEARDIFNSLAEEGNPEAQMGAGFLYATGELIRSVVKVGLNKHATRIKN